MASKPRTLKCPYTGVVQEVVLDETLGRLNGFYLSAGLDLTIPFLSEAEALAACGGELKCKYTGDPLTLRRDKGLWYLDGAYSPRKRWYLASLARYHGSMRNGRSFEKKPPAPVQAKALEAPPPHPFADQRKYSDMRPQIMEMLK